MKLSSVALSLCLSAASAVVPSTNLRAVASRQLTTCVDGEEEAVFSFVVDDHPEQNGWDMVCDGNIIWNVEVGSLSTEVPGSFVTHTSCISRQSTCDLTIRDSAGDGFVGQHGWYFFKYGATTIAVSTEEDSRAFDERHYCFGPQCEQVPLEDQNLLDLPSLHQDEPKKCVSGQQEEAVFTLFADEFPEETSWQLECNGSTIFSATQGDLEGQAPGTQNTQRACIDLASACNFYLHDADGDGLVGEQGWYYLKYGATTIAVSTEESTTEFTLRHYCFGPSCGNAPLEEDQLDADDLVEDEKTCTYGVEEEAVFTLFTDEFPEESGWELVCDGEMVFSSPVGRLEGQLPGTQVTQRACVAQTASCDFQLHDDGGDGLVGYQGWYFLKYGAKTIAVSTEEEETDFLQRYYCFGPNCNQPSLEEIDAEQVDTDRETMEGDQAVVPPMDDPSDAVTEDPLVDDEEEILKAGPVGDGFRPQDNPTITNNDSKDDSNVGVIVGSILGGMCLFALAVAFVVRRRMVNEK